MGPDESVVSNGVAPQRPGVGEVTRLKSLVQQFAREFGFLVAKRTPCGHAVSPSYAHCLMVLLERESAALDTTQTELGARLAIDKSNIARICAKLEVAGHAVQSPATDDARRRIVRLTPKGRRMATQIDAASNERFYRVMSAIDPKQRKTLLESMSALNAAIQTLEKVDEL